MTNGELMIKTIESVMGVEFDKSFDWREFNSHDVVIAFDGTWWGKENTMTDKAFILMASADENTEVILTPEQMDRIKQCDVVECEDCPRYADDCDGEEK